jgi:hypothetical protein
MEIAAAIVTLIMMQAQNNAATCSPANQLKKLAKERRLAELRQP